MVVFDYFKDDLKNIVFVWKRAF